MVKKSAHSAESHVSSIVYAQMLVGDSKPAKIYKLCFYFLMKLVTVSLTYLDTLKPHQLLAMKQISLISLC